jgi:isoleucyl-tRNA synthetase
MFDKVPSTPDLVAGEHEVLKMWRETNAFEKARARNAGKPKWSFLDGPITANNPMGVHHAWGRTFKDLFCRYFSMTGHDERYQNGFDCQGLWVEVEVEKELGIRSKRDIENLVPGDRFASIDRFVTACKARVDKFARRQTEQSIRLGQWMDWDGDEDWKKPPDQRRSYFTMSEVNNYTIWTFLKKCHTRGLIYKAYDSMPWCPRCAVGISQMEMHEGYQFVAHRAVFVRFPLRERPGENLLVWTTTPWTLTSNVGAAVNPDLTYVKVKHRDEVYYLAKGALTANRLEEDFKRGNWVEGVPKLKQVAQIFKEKGGYEVLGELKGSEMLGWTFDGPFDDLAAQAQAFGYPSEIARVVQQQKWSPAISGKDVHRVIAWDQVGETEGTGIVHIAPGCGKEDFELGKSLGLPPIAPLDEEGVFLPDFGPLAGKSAFEPATVDQILELLTKKGVLVAVERYPHNYPHCWRCKTELLFRLVDEWYIHMGNEDDPNSYRRQIMRVTEDVRFLPESINGKARELDWLRNMGDWMISKKRYWGLALPIWVCEDDSCGGFDVIGDRAELRARAIEGWDKFEGRPPHRPWVDLVKVKCAKCGGVASRITDVGNPWLDAGIVPYSTVRYNGDRAYWEEWFPADFITECFPGQFRNWFYAILAMSTMMEGRAPFKVLLGHALVRDETGEEMHKSAGNAIQFEGAASDGFAIACHKSAASHELVEIESDEQAQAEMKSRSLPDGASRFEIGEVDRKGKKSRVLMIRYPAMGSDVMRWLYCRQNPSQNLNFGYTPGREVERQVFNTLWNCYAFFVNYARLDAFDPAAPLVPVAERPEIDRWILSNLQLLIQTFRTELESFNTTGAVRPAEEFIEDLSNWYIRRNRRRFWRSRSEDDRDKLAAYQTLYEVLLTLCKLLAPVIPFLTERLYQNLRGEGQGARGEGRGAKSPAAGTVPESVHHCDYPQADRGLIDEKLSFQMQVIKQLVTTGHALREQASQRVRQPLAEIRVAIGACGPEYRDAVDHMQSLALEELNIKQMAIVPDIAGLTSVTAKPNFATLGPRYGKDVPKIAGALGKAPAELLRKLTAGEAISLGVDDRQLEIGPQDVMIQVSTQAGWVVGAAGCMQVAINSTLTTELRQEGLARDVIRYIQQERKDQSLNIEDHIKVWVNPTGDLLRDAITRWAALIKEETLCDDLQLARVDDGGRQVSASFAGTGCSIELQVRKAH